MSDFIKTITLFPHVIHKGAFSIMRNLSKYRLSAGMNTTSSGKLIYLLLLEIIDTNNQVIVSQKQISQTLGLSKGTVSQTLQKLDKDGYIRIKPQFNEYGGQLPNRYEIR